jgi:hypothetical protein
MTQTEAVSPSALSPARSRFLVRLFMGFAILVVLSAGISVAGKLMGHTIAMAGHTDDARPFEIVIGNNVLDIPGNEIRFEQARINGVAPRIDLYVAWPSMRGYSEPERALFNNSGEAPSLIFMAVDDRMMSRDMSGRFEPIHSTIIERPARRGPADLAIYRFSEKSGYTDESLVVGPVVEGTRFVARCLTGEAGRQSLAPCERDINFGRDLTLTYRFPQRLLAQWASLDEAVRHKAESYLKTPIR